MIPSDFFPQGISYFFTEEQQGTDVLSAQEKEVAQSFGTKRLADFCTGRYCLRKSTEAHGYNGDILIGERGMPLLPSDITASVSHSKKLCGAIAARKDQYLSTGLDIETIGRVHGEMWHLLFTDNETQLLNGMNEQEQNKISTAFFSLKEAFYKFQYPLSKVYLDFREVEIEMTDGQYNVKLLVDAGNAFAMGQTFAGNIVRHNDEIISLCTMPA